MMMLEVGAVDWRMGLFVSNEKCHDFFFFPKFLYFHFVNSQRRDVTRQTRYAWISLTDNLSAAQLTPRTKHEATRHIISYPTSMFPRPEAMLSIGWRKPIRTAIPVIKYTWWAVEYSMTI